MALAMQSMIAPVTGVGASQLARKAEAQLNISVVFTSVKATLAALKEAGNLLGRQANSLGGCINLIVPQIVPYPLSLTNPPVIVDFNERRLRVIAGGSRVEIRVSVYLCRDPLETLPSIFTPHSLVFLGIQKQWWWTAEKRLAAKLRRAGHEVVVTEGK